ncbi:MAG: hypothetical protein CMJ36_03055 [Phycisphaerae bacterium]|nr:hypothetical protein [Phycisphaerae bacterium]
MRNPEAWPESTCSGLETRTGPVERRASHTGHVERMSGMPGEDKGTVLRSDPWIDPAFFSGFA